VAELKLSPNHELVRLYTFHLCGAEGEMVKLKTIVVLFASAFSVRV
jgi:hypothetical protein